ncbi:MAG: ATP-binding protein [Archaeoglobaceae archaeon]
MSAFDKAKREYNQAKTREDYKTAEKRALECARILRQLSSKVPEQKNSYLEKAKKWENTAEIVEETGSKKIVEKGESEEDELQSYAENLISDSKIRWECIGGLSEVKQLMMETIVIAGLQKPESIKPWKGVLLFGPPGTGKTLLAAASAGSLNATFFEVKADKVLSKYFGESSKIVSSLYSTARKHSPSIVFVDEFDALSLSRSGDINEASRRMLSTLLSELDGFQDKKSERLVLTLAATNTPWDLDQAALSRFPKRIFVPLPDSKTCKKIVKIETEDLDTSKLELDEIAKKCVEKLYSGRDVSTLCQEAKWSMVRDENKGIYKMAELPYEEIKKHSLKTRPLTMEDFNKAFNKIKSPLNKKELQKYEEWNEEFGE